MSTPPPVTPGSSAAAEPRTRVRDAYRRLPGARRALVLYGAVVLGGLVLMPLLVFLVGNRMLGPYTHGQNLHAGPAALFADFVTGLAHGSLVFWAVALGPAALLLATRLFVRLYRALP